ncbi:hypothetical protein CYMTET_53966 [Cymbomonas tetramitiformis]|nr:hypothetical protein CYMTET_53966 [Cymbomonas tetramitiformis]
MKQAYATELAGSNNLLTLPKDLATGKGCSECISEALDFLGRLDVLVNNAGAGKLGSSIENTSSEDWDWHIDINLKSVFLLTQASVPHLAATKGCVINVSSIAAQRPFPNLLPYCVSKAAVDQLTRCCALELASKGIRVNAINPATVVTEFHEKAGMGKEAAAEFYQESASAHPIGRVGTPLDIANMCLFLASTDNAGWITGQTWLMDGGRLLTCQAGKALSQAAN